MQRLRPTLIALAILALSATVVFAAGPARPAFAPGSHQPEATESAEPSDSVEAGHPVNHGCGVSLAAKTATPSGFKNHGQWVSSIAKDNHGYNQSGDTNTCTLPTSSPAPSATANPT